jgi:hypothetical protein
MILCLEIKILKSVKKRKKGNFFLLIYNLMGVSLVDNIYNLVRPGCIVHFIGLVWVKTRTLKILICVFLDCTDTFLLTRIIINYLESFLVKLSDFIGGRCRIGGGQVLEIMNIKILSIVVNILVVLLKKYL